MQIGAVPYGYTRKKNKKKIQTPSIPRHSARRTQQKTTRPICKQATNQRIAASEKCRIKAFQYRVKIRLAKQRLVKEKMNESERSALVEEIEKMEKSCKGYDTRSHNRIPKTFAADLERELSESGAHFEDPQTGGCVREVVVAEFQADLHMSAQIVSRQAVMVESRDTDIPIIAGGGEDEGERGCIAIKNFTNKKRLERMIRAS
mgnify:CR=1 FL=1